MTNNQRLQTIAKAKKFVYINKAGARKTFHLIKWRQTTENHIFAIIKYPSTPDKTFRRTFLISRIQIAYESQ